MINVGKRQIYLNSNKLFRSHFVQSVCQSINFSLSISQEPLGHFKLNWHRASSEKGANLAENLLEQCILEFLQIMIPVEQSKVTTDGGKYLHRNKKGKYYLVRKARTFVEASSDGILNSSLFKQPWAEMDHNEGLIFYRGINLQKSLSIWLEKFVRKQVI